MAKGITPKIFAHGTCCNVLCKVTLRMERAIALTIDRRIGCSRRRARTIALVPDRHNAALAASLKRLMQHVDGGINECHDRTATLFGKRWGLYCGDADPGHRMC